MTQLRGIATAMYGPAENTTVSLTTLVSTSADQIEITGSEKRQANVGNRRQLREAMEPVLREVSKHRAQMVQTVAGQGQVPIAVVHGVQENHPEAAYRRGLKRAFPQHVQMGSEDGVTKLMETVLLRHHAQNAQGGSVIELNDYYLYTDEEGSPFGNLAVTPNDIELGRRIDALLQSATTGDQRARAELEEVAKLDARQYAADLQQRNIPPPRFVQFGLQRAEFQNCPRYTYLESFNLKDVFVAELMRFMAKPHNVCVKTPHMESSPPFADICATHLADYWDLVTQHEGKRQVYAQKQDT